MTSAAIVAHRGESSAAPENTMAAFERAWHLGVDYVELDYHHARDGVPVVIHDPTIDRTTNAKQLGYPAHPRVDQLTVQELSQLNAADWESGKWRDFKSCAIPTVQAVLQRAAELGTQCVIERKAGDPGTICDLLQQYQMVNRARLIAFERDGGWDFLCDCQLRLSQLRVGYLIQSDLTMALVNRLIHQYACRWVNCNHQLLDASMVQEMRSCGLEVWAWTVNDRDRARVLCDWGVSGITTDYPARMIGIISPQDGRTDELLH